MIWNQTSNPDSLCLDFKQELTKDSISKGNWHDDYINFCTHFKAIPCPLFQHGTMSTGTFVRISNSVIDNTSWRAFLLALSISGSNVREISFHAVQLDPNQIIELASAIAKMGFISVVKIDYIYFNSVYSMVDYKNAFVHLLSNSVSIEYLSLKGNKFGNDTTAAFVSSLSNNFSIKAINLSDNCISDEVASSIIRSLRTNISLQHVSFKSNFISKSTIKELTSIVIGSDVTPEDELFFKNLPKAISERNKAIKDMNKKRGKKTGIPELSEIPVPAPDRIVKINGIAKILNKTINFIDFSNNSAVDPLDIKALVREVNEAATLAPSDLNAATQIKLLLMGVKLTLLPKEEFVCNSTRLLIEYSAEI